MNKKLTIIENRKFLGLFGALALVIAYFIFNSSEPRNIRVMFGSIVVLLGCYPLYRFFRPRWVIRLGEGKFRYQDFVTKQVTEVELAHIQNVCVVPTQEIGIEAGKGFGLQHEMVLETPQGKIQLPLPIMQVSAIKAGHIVRTYLALVNESKNQPQK